MDNVEWIDLVQRLGPKLYRFFLLKGLPTNASESVQEVFVRLIDKVQSSSFKKELGNLDAYAWGIAMNLQKEQARASRKNNQTVDPNEIMNFVDPNVPPAHADDLLALKKAVLNLEEPEKTIFQLILSDMPIREISSVLGLPEGTVKSHIHRGKEQIRKKLKIWGIL